MTTESILSRIAAGEEAAVRECLDRYAGLVWSLALRLCPTRETAEDAVQDAFVSVWKSAGRFDENQGSEVTFISMIARRRIVDRMRRAGRVGRGMVDDEQAAKSGGTAPANESERIDRSEDVQAALDAIGELSEDQQRVIRMSVMNGLSHQQIADATGIPLGTVKTHLRRGLIRVREKLADLRDRRVGVTS